MELIHGKMSLLVLPYISKTEGNEKVSYNTIDMTVTEQWFRTHICRFPICIKQY